MFLVATHFATALVLLLFFWKDWVRIVKGIVPFVPRPGDQGIRSRREARMALGRGNDPCRHIGTSL